MTLSSACIPVFSKPSSSKLQMDIRYKFLHMLDTESQEILSNQLLEQALNFIEQTQQNEKPIPIVVHWYYFTVNKIDFLYLFVNIVKAVLAVQQPL